MLAELANPSASELENEPMHDPTKHFPPPIEPPLPSTGAGDLQGWFEALRATDAEVTQYATGIVGEHYARAGVEVRPELAGARDWNGFALYLAGSLMPIIDGGGNLDWVRALLADLVTFSLANPAGSPESRLINLLAQFIQWEPDYARRRRVTALLPTDKVGGALQVIKEREDEEQRRKEEAYW